MREAKETEELGALDLTRDKIGILSIVKKKENMVIDLGSTLIPHLNTSREKIWKEHSNTEFKEAWVRNPYLVKESSRRQVEILLFP